MANSCSICRKSFKTDVDLHSHRCKICKKCIYCDYNFVFKSSKQIRKHMIKKHSDVPCEICNRKFFLTGGRNDHMRDAHGENTRLVQATLKHVTDCGGADVQIIYNRVTTVQQQHKLMDDYMSMARPSRAILNTCFMSDLRSCGNRLKRLLDEKVRQDPDKMRTCNEIVHHLVTFMQHNVKYKVSEVVKGGSLGKGTSIKEKVDIDLVVFLKDFKSVADLQEHREEVIKDLKKHILKDFTFAKQVHYNYDTQHSNRFGLRIDDGPDLIQVDLLPACDIGGGSEQVFDEMAGLDDEARSFYSVSFASDQVRFTKEKPEMVKDVIRLIKHWKTREKLKIPSYTVEIVTIKEWERMGRPDKPDLDQLFKKSMTQLSNFGGIKITWPNARATDDRRPIVMDPANPFNNTASLIGPSDQKVIERKAREVVSWLQLRF